MINQKVIEEKNSKQLSLRLSYLCNGLKKEERFHKENVSCSNTY